MGRPKGSKNHDTEGKRNLPCKKCGGPRKEYAKGRFQCEPCKVASAAQWRKDNPQRFADIYNNSRYMREYGITLADVLHMLGAQNYSCAICSRSIRLAMRGEGPAKDDTAFVDHCHKTKWIRGLLCRKCNSMLGFANDQPATLIAALVYLESNNAR